MFNPAQHILLALGVDPITLIAHSRPRSASWTKKGPGRRHQHLSRAELRAKAEEQS